MAAVLPSQGALTRFTVRQQQHRLTRTPSIALDNVAWLSCALSDGLHRGRDHRAYDHIYLRARIAA
jgi:hypothetical protein